MTDLGAAAQQREPERRRDDGHARAPARARMQAFTGEPTTMSSMPFVLPWPSATMSANRLAPAQNASGASLPSAAFDDGVVAAMMGDDGGVGRRRRRCCRRWRWWSVSPRLPARRDRRPSSSWRRCPDRWRSSWRGTRGRTRRRRGRGSRPSRCARSHRSPQARMASSEKWRGSLGTTVKPPRMARVAAACPAL